jgi:hypothetical protein
MGGVKASHQASKQKDQVSKQKDKAIHQSTTTTMGGLEASHLASKQKDQPSKRTKRPSKTTSRLSQPLQPNRDIIIPPTAQENPVTQLKWMKRKKT